MEYQLVGRAYVTGSPWLPNCEVCDNQLLGRGDGMPSWHVEVQRAAGPARALRIVMCDPCAEEFLAPAGSSASDLTRRLWDGNVDA